MTDTSSRKWQITLNNYAEKNWTSEAIKQALAEIKPIIYYCMAEEIGLENHTPHIHIYTACSSPVRFSTLKKRFPEAHIEAAKGTHIQNRDYVAKTGKWENDEKHGTQVPGSFFEVGTMPEEKGQGFRSDLEEISDMINQGMNPAEIMANNFTYYKYERMIRSAYFAKRKRETPVHREIKLHYIVGESGSGKSFTYVSLCEEHGEDNVFFLTDYDGGGFDTYCGEPILFMDEYKGQLQFSQLLTMTDVYKAQIHARYTNVLALWNEIYITSVFPPEELYKKMVEADLRGLDKQKQLFRRISDITYCFVDDTGQYQRFTLPMQKYRDYADLKARAIQASTPSQFSMEDFVEVETGDDEDLPF